MSKIIGISGKSCSGKTSIATEITKMGLGYSHLPADNFMKALTPLKFSGYDNWDCPECIDFKKIIETIRAIKDGRNVYIPSKKASNIYDLLFQPTKTIILEGFLLFLGGELEDLIEQKIFLDISEETFIKRRLERFQKMKDYPDSSQFLYSPEYLNSVSIPMFRKYDPIQKSHADIVLNAEKDIASVLSEVRAYLEI